MKIFNVLRSITGIGLDFDRRRFLIFFMVIFVIFLIGAGLFVKYSTTAQFCRSCHIMEPYYNAWAGSLHSSIQCTECHYTPGLRNTVWQKFQALSQVAKYVTRTYSSKPHADIDDSSCLRSGCHETRLLKGKEEFTKGVMFNHAPHLGQLRRGKKLRCTSCHSQIVIGNHIEVTTSTCFVCHFKGEHIDEGIPEFGNCTTCHAVPEKDFVFGKVTFNHKMIVENGKTIECKMCHDVIRGTGLVPEERCSSCHNEPGRIARKNETDFLHQTHITTHNVPCFECHQEILHKNFKVENQIASLGKKSDERADELNCQLCHKGKHQGILDMFIGQGGKGLTTTMPGSMYTTNVHCNGCHQQKHYKEGESMEIALHFDGVDMLASEQSCAVCHEKTYNVLLDKWRVILDESLKLFRSNLAEVIKKPGAEAAPLDEVRYNLDFIQNAKGVHNVYYSAMLFRTSFEKLQEEAVKAGYDISNMEKNQIVNGSYCLNLCHKEVEPKKIPEEVKFNGIDMPHRFHWEDEGISCFKCHTIGHHKEVTFKTVEETCFSCHDKDLFGW